MGRESAIELRAVAPLIVTGGASPQLVGPCTLVTNGAKLVAFSSAEMLREAPEPLAIALTFDCKVTIPVPAWTMTRSPFLGIIELGNVSATFRSALAAAGGAVTTLDVEPLPIAGISASVDTRGAPSALVTFHVVDGRIVRRFVPVHVDAIDGGGMSDDVLMRLASPDEPGDIDAPVDGAALLSWMPPDPVLGRKAETVVVAFATPYTEKTWKPRELPPIAQLHGLEDLARALPPPRAVAEAEASNELGQVAGEIKDEPSQSIDVNLDD